MAKYTGPSNKLFRNKKVKDLSNRKLTTSMKQNASGQHGAVRKKLSEYALHLTEKQKIRFTYGISEKQLKKTFERAGKLKGIHGENMLKLLESRLDNIVYRMGLSTTRSGARQFVNHGHVSVNGRKVDIPSYQVKPGDVIAVRENSKEHKAMKESLEKINKTVDYVSFDKVKLEGTYLRLPERSELSSDINESLVVEFYNK